MDITLATSDIDGKPRDVIMHAPKNGFFYVIDRATGKLISAEKLGKVTWAKGIDMKTGRPIEVNGARYEDGEALVWPGSAGLHNWPPMSYSPNRSEEHTSELQSLMRISYAVFCLKKKKKKNTQT